MAKDKKKKKSKKANKAAGGSAVRSIKSITQNPLVADIVAAALVATASALKDSKKAQKLASDAGDEITKLSKAGAKRGGALWDMALQIGRESLEALSGEIGSKSAKPKARASKAKPAARKTAAKRTTASRTARARKTTKKPK